MEDPNNIPESSVSHFQVVPVPFLNLPNVTFTVQTFCLTSFDLWQTLHLTRVYVSEGLVCAH